MVYNIIVSHSKEHRSVDWHFKVDYRTQLNDPDLMSGHQIYTYILKDSYFNWGSL